MLRSTFFKFTSSICLCYVSYSVILGFAALFMQHKGFGNTIIGLFFSCSAMFCILMQTISGSFLDKHPDISARHFMLAVNILVTLAGIPLYFTNKKSIIFVCYIIIGSIMLLNSSLYNALGMEYINAGIPLNYSLARGCASCVYAVIALIMGYVLAHHPVSVLVPIFVLSQLGMIASTYALKPAKREAPSSVSDKCTPGQKTASNLFAFLKQNPVLLFLLVSILFVYISYTSVNNFQINIIEAAGGGSAELGTSTFIAAMLELPAMAMFLPLSRKLSYKTLLCVSSTFFFIKILSLSMAEIVIGIYLSQCLQFFSYGLFVPASAYFINQILPTSDMAKGQAALGIFTFGLSGLFASLLSGILLDCFSVKAMLCLESALALIGVIGVFEACKKLTQTNHNSS